MDQQTVVSPVGLKRLKKKTAKRSCHRAEK